MRRHIALTGLTIIALAPVIPVALADAPRVTWATATQGGGFQPIPVFALLGYLTVAELQVIDGAFRFIDNGGGIAEEKLPHIFDPFFTTKAPGKGTGLGLPIVKKLLARSGSEIKLESTLGKGSTFSFELDFGRVAKAIEKVVPCERIGMSVIGLEVPHAHVHLVPIRSVADLNFGSGHQELDADEMAELASDIRQAMA